MAATHFRETSHQSASLPTTLSVCVLCYETAESVNWQLGKRKYCDEM